MDEEEVSPPKKKPQNKAIVISNRLFSDENQKRKNTNFIFKIENEPVPVNEYLSYELSEQINSGLYEVKILAEEIKQIKKEKLEMMEDKNKFKPTNKIRIKKYQNTKWKAET